MSRRDGLRKKKCGCVVFTVGPPMLCANHQQKKTIKEKKELRNRGRELAATLGHDLSDFREYPSTPNKWVVHCHACGALGIVYDELPRRGDQIAGPAFGERCRGDRRVSRYGE